MQSLRCQVSELGWAPCDAKWHSEVLQISTSFNIEHYVQLGVQVDWDSIESSREIKNVNVAVS